MMANSSNHDEYENYLKQIYRQNEELGSYLMDESVLGCYHDSSSPDGTVPLMASRSVASERIRRKKLNESLYALRSVVPNITKMDKASIVKDAIDHITLLHEQDRALKTEIFELENKSRSNNKKFKKEETTISSCSRPKRTAMDRYHQFEPSPIEVLELRVASMGGKTVAVTMTCNKRRDTIRKLCEMFESLNLRIITSNFTAFSDKLFNTLFIEVEEEEKEMVKEKIQAAIAHIQLARSQ